MLIEFRKAEITDREWVWGLFKDLLKPSIEAQWGWQEAFQEESFGKHLPITQFKIIQNKCERVGAFYLVKNVDHIHLKMLLVKDEFQSMGIGKQVVNYTKSAAIEHDLPVNLGVIKSNPVVGFYTSLGFSVLGDENGSYKLQWNPNA